MKQSESVRSLGSAGRASSGRVEVARASDVGDDRGERPFLPVRGEGRVSGPAADDADGAQENFTRSGSMPAGANDWVVNCAGARRSPGLGYRR
jgi:hypothetical protein